MTEAEWLKSDDPLAMLRFVEDKMDFKASRSFLCTVYAQLSECFPHPSWVRKVASIARSGKVAKKSPGDHPFLLDVVQNSSDAMSPLSDKEYELLDHLEILVSDSPSMNRGIAYAIACAENHAAIHICQILRQVINPFQND